MNLETKKIHCHLDEITKELSMYNKFTHQALLTHFIHNRLTDTLKAYNLEMEKSAAFLSNKCGVDVLKAISKKAKQADKAIIERYMMED